MSLIIGNPAKYIQGPGAIGEIGRYVLQMRLGRKALVVGGKKALLETQTAIETSFRAHNISFVMEPFGGEATIMETDRLVLVAEKTAIDFVVGVGGGKVVDVAKVAAMKLGVPVVIIPTVAATDAYCSATGAFYGADHVFSEVIVCPRNPELILVSTDILVKAPGCFLVAGMGDALSTRFEADASYRAGRDNFHGGTPAQSALILARWCTDTILKHGKAAKESAGRGVIGPEFEAVVEAAVYASSVSWENCGLAGAHGLTLGFTVLEETRPYLHGELVGFFTLVEMILEKQPAAIINQTFQFCHAVGLPVTLAEIGLPENDKAPLLRGADAAVAPGSLLHNEPFPVTADMVYRALMETNQIGHAL